ncbi:MAG: hypothetical protein KJP02_06720 [Octadecabacter sp.]|nr:hypothetical protein [Octadecabacter sp.]
MPDIEFDSIESIPEGLRGHETKDEASGKFVVKVAPNAKLVEFRDNNISLSKERDELKNSVSRFSSIVGENPDDFAEELTRLRNVAQQVEDGKLKGNEAVEAEVQKRVKAMEDSYKSQLTELGGKVQTLDQARNEALGKFKHSVLNQQVTNAVLTEDSGANPAALPDILARASRIFTVNERDQLVAMDGDAVIYGADGATPMTPKEWLSKVIEEAPYLAKSSAGGGAAGNRGNERFGGMAEADFLALDPQKRMEIARSIKK